MNLLRFLAIVYKDEEKMLYPYTTKGGNLSFHLNDYQFINFEDVKLTD